MLTPSVVAGVLVSVGCRGEPRGAAPLGLQPQPDVGAGRTFGQPTPACRLDTRWNSLLERSIEMVLEQRRRTHPAEAMPDVHVGRDDRQENGGIHVAVVRDAYVGEVDRDGCFLANPPEITSRPGPPKLDSVSVAGSCDVAGRRLRCADGAVAALQGARGAGADFPSAALLFVIAHELGHVFRGRSAGGVEPTPVVQLGAPVREKIQTITDFCGGEGVLDEELAADKFAQEALAGLLRRPPYYERGLGEAASVEQLGREVALGADALDTWSAKRLGATNVHRIPFRQLSFCSLMSRTQGVVLLPRLRGTHPRGARRSADLSSRFRDVARGLSSQPTASPADPASGLGNLPTLVREMAWIGGALDEKEAKFEDERSDEFCRAAQAADGGRDPCR
ncbi:MAG TPA: hypothetical protein VFS43_25635 [Polyangiaceae bacterium]|nr:hypothetical protein [Polyangiaceae bacterium]